MKLQDFDFRLALTAEVMADIACDNKDCPCQTPLLYGEQARNHLGDPLYKDCEVELWSGFYDSKGVKIYEGDIVKYRANTNPLVVVYEKTSFYIIDTSIERDFQVDCGWSLQGIYDNANKGYKDNKLGYVEVLGNIHENRETQ